MPARLDWTELRVTRSGTDKGVQSVESMSIARIRAHWSLALTHLPCRALEVRIRGRVLAVSWPGRPQVPLRPWLLVGYPERHVLVQNTRPPRSVPTPLLVRCRLDPDWCAVSVSALRTASRYRPARSKLRTTSS